MLSRLHMRLQPRSHAVAGTLPGAACLESLERAGQSDNFELETHWRMLVLGGGTGAGTLAPPRPTHHPAPRPEHAAHSTSSTWLLYQPPLPAYFASLLYLLTYSTYLLTPSTYLLHLLTYLLTPPTHSTYLRPCMCTRKHLLTCAAHSTHSTHST